MEPAVKPASENTHSGVIGVMATPATFAGELFASLVERFANNVRVLTQVCPGLVEAVEAGQLDSPETQALLHTYLTPLLQAGIDQLVLGCTHYPFLTPGIQRIVGPNVRIIDPAPAVARQVQRVLEQQPTSNLAAQQCFYTTGCLEQAQPLFNRLVGANVPLTALKWLDGCLVP